MKQRILFDDTVATIEAVLRDAGPRLEGETLWFVRDLFGRVRLVAMHDSEEESAREDALVAVGDAIADRLGAHGLPEESCLFLDPERIAELRASPARKLKTENGEAYLVDRQVTGQSWSSVAEVGESHPPRLTLYSLKGGVGRTTAGAVLAMHLAKLGHKVLIVDFDLEAPGSSAVLSEDEVPELGIVDWFVEDLVGQGDTVLEKMTGRSSLTRDLEGDIWVAVAHGKEAGEYLPKLGRAYLDRPPAELGESAEPWTGRAQRLLRSLEARVRPSVVLIDSRSGIHDLSAAAVTDLGADVLLFARNSEPTWTGYRALFEHWLTHGMAEAIRDRLHVVAAQLPSIPRVREDYLQSLREETWKLFSEKLYDEVPPSDASGDQEFYSFDLDDGDAPHYPLPIYWHPDLAYLPALRELETSMANAAFGDFLQMLALRMPGLFKSQS